MYDDVQMDHEPVTARPSESSNTAATPIFPSHQYIYIAIDTNVLISHLDLVKKVYFKLQGSSAAQSARTTQAQASSATRHKTDQLKETCLLLPCIVLDELDRFKMKGPAWSSPPAATSMYTPSQGQASGPMLSLISNDSLDLSMHRPGNLSRNRNGPNDLQSSAREAVAWLFEVLRAEEQRQVKVDKKKSGSPSIPQIWRSIRFQKRDEKMGVGILNLPKKADTQILDCCRYFSSAFQGGSQVVLWTNDRNLRLQAEVHNVPTIGYPSLSAQSILNEVRQRLDHDQVSNREIPEVSKSPTETKPRLVLTGDISTWDPANRPEGSSPVKELSKKQKARAKKAQKKTEVAVSPSLQPTVRNIDARLSQIIPIQLYSFLLSKLFNDDPVRLREFLTADDPGPGIWDTRHCLHLIEKSWTGLSLSGGFPPETLAVMWEGTAWLRRFWEWYTEPSRAHLRPGGTAAEKMSGNLDAMHIDEAHPRQPQSNADNEALCRDWTSAGQALILVFGGLMEDDARHELEEVVRWMNSGT